MVRNIVAGFAGIIVAGLLVWLVEMLGHTVYPPPTDLKFADADSCSQSKRRLSLLD